ncbi:glycosyltransferase [Caldicoprobacter algeriensis]|uniref:glycosyltransferase n=1 Tax=Caldicoprobacter algeriensis TaxID=699281 RepID=UPI00207A1A06|nr:glycosyltransferase [Caldicoprobacter algeriensis]MCM8901344.1 glycosyltransferase [Caldicoprobacter algeriensis]
MMLYDLVKMKNEQHIFRMTDDTGMLQHAKYGVPDPTKGYTTDDNARALIMAVLLYEQRPVKRYETLIYRYTSFLLNAQNEDGWFRNFMGYDRRFIEERGSEDCFGRCLWALGFTISNEHVPINIRRVAKYILDRALLNCSKLLSLRGKAYSIIGLGFLDGDQAKEMIRSLATSLTQEYYNHCREDWKWFEDVLTYSNAVLPWAMLVAFQATGEQRFRDIGLESLSFLEKHTFNKGYFKPIGCYGWFEKGGKAAEFDEQPIEACEMLLAYLKAYEITEEDGYLEKAKKCYRWYTGYNSKGVSLIDPETGGCYDGITKDGVNLNQGAESLISYYISILSMERLCNGSAKKYYYLSKWA